MGGCRRNYFAECGHRCWQHYWSRERSHPFGSQDVRRCWKPGAYIEALGLNAVLDNVSDTKCFPGVNWLVSGCGIISSSFDVNADKEFR